MIEFILFTASAIAALLLGFALDIAQRIPLNYFSYIYTAFLFVLVASSRMAMCLARQVQTVKQYETIVRVEPVEGKYLHFIMHKFFSFTTPVLGGVFFAMSLVLLPAIYN